jgi:K+-transporting ATPase ATPase C chain
MKTIATVLKLLLALSVLTGLVYPGLATVIAQLFYREKAGGSLISYKGKIIGSQLIGQQFDSSIWFNPRPSSINYNPLPSGGSNLSSTNKNLLMLVNERYKFFIKENFLSDSTEIPSEMLYASASGLDPHISPRAAILQINRIADARGFDDIQKEKLHGLITRMTEPPQFHLFGEERINVFMLNLELDNIK